MQEQNKQKDLVFKALQERAKELNCLYKIEELFSKINLTLDEIFFGIVHAIPQGWQYPEFCFALLIFDDKIYGPASYIETKWVQRTDILVQDVLHGSIQVFYKEEMPHSDEGPFLKEERKLINTIADRIGHYLLIRQLKQVFDEFQTKQVDITEKPKPEWTIVLDLLRKTDQPLFSIISRKMINHLFCKGITESKYLFKKLGAPIDDESTSTELNSPSKREVLDYSYALGIEIFTVASQYLSDDEILSSIHKWMYEEKSTFLVKPLANMNTPLSEIADAIRRYYHINPFEDKTDNSSAGKGIIVALVRRFLTDQLDFINIAKDFCSIRDFYNLLQKMIFPADSSGKLGGKSSGLFLAKKIIENSKDYKDVLSSVKTPKTWYITSDGLLNFIYYNNLEEIIEQKYKEIDVIRQEYPHVIQACKNSNFSAEIANGLSRALDDFGKNPIIVRSSSLLEDRMGSAFAGKYKSLFLANQGTKQERLEALMDAIAEVYASTFGPDPIGYRIERGLLDFDEEMGIMIQEVVGKRIGKYFFPAFAGVAFSNNEFRWSPRIKREDGLIRIVPGLGTRAVDRTANDYPILIAPGQPNLRVNLTFDEIVGYSPRFVDIINLESNTFDTISVQELIEEIGNDYPMINDVFSIVSENHLQKPVGLGIDTRKHEITVTFENLITNTSYFQQLHTILKELNHVMQVPVDIEFACDGDNLYLLQCRPQSSSQNNISVVIPKDIQHEKIVFSANRYVSNGIIPDVYYIVYIDPLKYSEHEELSDLKEIGRIVGKLNKILPKKRFILMGPGRWGSRDDIRLGVKVTYSDINNTAILIEIARKKGNYTPDLSFGTHFFQDLVEAQIQYLPLYPDDPNIVFNESFLLNSENHLTRFLPDDEYLADTIKVINVREVTDGNVLRILMNADQDEAVAIISDPLTKLVYSATPTSVITKDKFNEPLQWRLNMIDSIVAKLDPYRFGVKDVYIFGSIFNHNVQANSDMNLLFHFDGNAEQKRDLINWLDGWNLCLSEINFYKTGFRVERILDINIKTDEELTNQKYFADIIDPRNKSAKKINVVKRF